MLTITREFLENRRACTAGFKYWIDQNNPDLFDFVRQCKEDNHLDWANWLLARSLDKMGAVKYAIFSAEQVIQIFEKKYPGDNRPRKAIEAARKYLDNPNTAAADVAAAAYADAYARNEMRWKILEYGMELIKDGHVNEEIK